MRLNPDCTRDILMYFEEKTTPTDALCFTAKSLSEQSETLAKYSTAEIMYHLDQCSASGFFIQYKKDLTGNLSLRDISPKAHEFLANIREDTLWKKTKGIACEIGTTSLTALCQIASNVVSAIIQNKLG